MNSPTAIKLFIGVFAALLWAAALVAKHFWPDIDIGAFVTTCISVIAGTGAFHAASSSDAPPSASSFPPMKYTPPAGAPPAQGGFVSLLLLCGVALIALTLCGCASIEQAGNTGYEVKHGAAGCDLSAKDGKEFKGRKLDFDGDKCKLIVDEGDSKAFPGQALAAKALTVLPVTGLSDLIAPGAKP